MSKNSLLKERKKDREGERGKKGEEEGGKEGRKQSKYPSISFWLNKLWNVQAIKYYVATKSNKHWYRTTWNIFKRKKLTGYNLCKKYKHIHKGVYICTGNILQGYSTLEGYSQLTFLGGGQCVWSTGRQRHMNKLESVLCLQEQSYRDCPI